METDKSSCWRLPVEEKILKKMDRWCAQWIHLFILPLVAFHGFQVMLDLLLVCDNCNSSGCPPGISTCRAAIAVHCSLTNRCPCTGRSSLMLLMIVSGPVPESFASFTGTERRLLDHGLRCSCWSFSPFSGSAASPGVLDSGFHRQPAASRSPK